MQFLDAAGQVPGVRRIATRRRRSCRNASRPASPFPASAIASTRDPRAARLFQMALELEVEGGHVQMIRAVELAVAALPEGQALPVNIDGAIAAVCGDIGIPAEIANALFIISRVPGIAAQAQEERQREHPMRQIVRGRTVLRLGYRQVVVPSRGRGTADRCGRVLAAQGWEAVARPARRRDRRGPEFGPSR